MIGVEHINYPVPVEVLVDVLVEVPVDAPVQVPDSRVGTLGKVYMEGSKGRWIQSQDAEAWADEDNPRSGRLG